MARQRKSTSVIPAALREAAAAELAAQESRGRTIREQGEREQHCTDAVIAFRHARSALWAAMPDKAPSFLPAVHTTLLDACAALGVAGRLVAWEQLDHDATYARYRERNHRIMSRPSYDWARELFGRARDRRLPEAALAETWDAAGLRDAVRWLGVFVEGLSGEGAALSTVQEPAPSQLDGETAGAKKRRPCYARDHLWHQWAADQGLGQAAIRDLWNKEYREHGGKPIGSGRAGRDTVKEGLRKAGREQGG